MVSNDFHIYMYGGYLLASWVEEQDLEISQWKEIR